MVKDVLGQNDCNARPEQGLQIQKMVRKNLTGSEGIVFNRGVSWQEQRVFLINILKDFGIGKSDMEGMINHELALFCEKAEKTLISQINDPEEVVPNYLAFRNRMPHTNICRTYSTSR